VTGSRRSAGPSRRGSIEATRQLAGPDIDDPLAIVIVTTFDLDEYVHGALKAGARGFLLKDAGPELLVQAIRAAANGEALIAPSVTARLPPRSPIQVRDGHLLSPSNHSPSAKNRCS
jgi:DNA-binding NarL/FixJ family response regulator